MDLHKKVGYLCRKCGWKKQIMAIWADLKPRRCCGHKCKTSFLKEPEALLIYDPANPPGAEAVAVPTVEEKAKDTSSQVYNRHNNRYDRNRKS